MAIWFRGSLQRAQASEWSTKALMHLMPERLPAPMVAAMSMIRKHPWKLAAAMLACGYLRRHWLRGRALCASSSRLVVAEVATLQEPFNKGEQAVGDLTAQGNESFAAGRLGNDIENVGLKKAEKDSEVVTVTEEVIKCEMAESAADADAAGGSSTTCSATTPDDFESEACSLPDLQGNDLAKAELRSQLEKAAANVATMAVRPPVRPRPAPSVTMGAVVVGSPSVCAPPKKNLSVPHQARAARSRRYTSATGTPFSCMSLATTPGCVTPA